MNPNKRLLSLDVLRGITVAGMILVNNTGKCGYNFAAFAHAKWDGFSPADLVFRPTSPYVSITSSVDRRLRKS